MPRREATRRRSPSPEAGSRSYRRRSRSSDRREHRDSRKGRAKSPATAHHGGSDGDGEGASYSRKDSQLKSRDRSREQPRYRSRRSRSPSDGPSRSRSPSSHHRKPRRRRSRDDSDHGSRSRSPRRTKESRRRSHSRSPRPLKRSREPLPPQETTFREDQNMNGADTPTQKEKPNLKPTGLLAAETNKVTVGSGKSAQSVILKYHEPPEARKPSASEKWTMYVFKGASKDPLHTYHLHERTCWLLGRELAVADIPIEHPSCSKQHAILQFRYTAKKNEWGEKQGKVGLYLLDLESANGTFLNGERIDAARYTQLLSGDIVKFGESEREYVIILPPKE